MLLQDKNPALMQPPESRLPGEEELLTIVGNGDRIFNRR
jgi:hypothetical protein